MLRFSAFLDRCVDQDQDRLSEGGRDRTFGTFSRILVSLYSACRELTQAGAETTVSICGCLSLLSRPRIPCPVTRR